LLTRDPTKRLGSEDKMASDIRRHPFFKHIDWDQLYRKEIEAPFKPKVNSVLDLTWIDPIFKEENVRSHTAHDTTHWSSPHDTTRHMTHTGDRFRGGEVEDGRDGRWR
jgi:serine/threonine protein kinase